MKKEGNTLLLFSKNLIRLRKEARIAQAKLAALAGLTHNFVNDLENMQKTASFTSIDKLSKALNVEPMQFFIDPSQWNKKDSVHFLAVLDNFNKQFNGLFEYYRESMPNDASRAPKGRK